jgi:hypothetical protein
MVKGEEEEDPRTGVWTKSEEAGWVGVGTYGYREDMRRRRKVEGGGGEEGGIGVF